jgi:hypothetical protein
LVGLFKIANFPPVVGSLSGWLCRHALIILVSCLSGILPVSSVDAIETSAIKANKIGFISDPGELDFSLDLDVEDSLVTVEVPPKKLVIRAKKSTTDDRIEPLSLRVPKDPDQLAKLVVDIAKPRSRSKLHRLLMDEIRKADQKSFIDGHLKISLTEEALKWVRLTQLGIILGKPHHKIQILSQSLKSDRDTREELLRQIGPFFSSEEKNRLQSKLKKGESIELDQEMLPPFAKKMVGEFTVFRGPNCFHASLAFHGRQISNSPWFNVKEEKGYHRSMINYDELWRTLNSVFYEVDPKTTALEYGDIMVFFDLPKEKSPIDFRWIRHAAVYLFDEYSFSKGSKSPDTPYTVKTLDEEWTTWRKYTSNLGVKIFRRTQNRVKSRPPKELADWLY